MKDKLLKKLDKKTLIGVCKNLKVKHSRQANKATLITCLWLNVIYTTIIKTLKEVQND